jgi:hypothetical protein
VEFHPYPSTNQLTSGRKGIRMKKKASVARREKESKEEIERTIELGEAYLTWVFGRTEKEEKAFREMVKRNKTKYLREREQASQQVATE